MIPLILAGAGLAVLYLYHVQRGMSAVPADALALSPHRWTVDEIKTAYDKAIKSPVDVTKSLPPKQNRRYIIVGGSGLVGNWIATHLIARGENPAAVRVLDLQPPRRELLDQGVSFVTTNITDEKGVLAAFAQKWAPDVAALPLTVFHCAAVIRPGERHKAFLPLCRNVNVGGTVNVMNAAKQFDASCMIATSSGSVGVHRASFWMEPWRMVPKLLVQVVGDSTEMPKRHEQFFGNYAAAKAEAEDLVRKADDVKSNFRTGCIRPTNGIYGVGEGNSASVVANYLRSGGNPSWTYDILHAFVNAENVSIAHLLYEQRLLEHSNNPDALPNIGGQSFVVTDPNPAIAFSDIYLLLTTLSKTPVSFARVPAIPFLVLSHLVEWYALLQYRYCSWLPRVTGDLVQMQPSLFSVTNVHTFADDSRARKSPEQGGLGYNPPLDTLQGMCKEVLDWNEKVQMKANGSA